MPERGAWHARRPRATKPVAARGREVTGVRPEPAGVWLTDGRPARFVWRGRLYTVLSVIGRPARGRQPGSDVPDLPDITGTAWECWRVTASPGKNVPATAYQLCHDPAGDRWLLSRDGG
jgi:hypothetical protein